MRSSRTVAWAAVVAMITISGVRHEAAAQTARWTVQQDLSIGTAQDGPEALSDVSDLTIGSDGAIYVGQSNEQLVRVFDASGRVRGTIGRRGELMSVQHLGWRGDTLLVTDPRRYSVGAYSTAGQHRVTRSFAGLRRFVPRAVLADGRVLGSTLVPSSDIESGRVRFEELRVATRRGTGDALLARLPLRHHTGHVRVASAAGPLDGYFGQPFGDPDLYDVDPSGRWIVTVSRPNPASRQQATYLIRRLTVAGRTAWETRIPYVPEALTPRVLADTLSAYVRMLTDVPEAADLRREARAAFSRAMYAPGYLSAATRVVAGRDGTTWVRGRSFGRMVAWTVLDDLGRVAATVDIPADLEVHAADRANVWGVAKDASGIPFVRRLRIRQPR